MDSKTLRNIQGAARLFAVAFSIAFVLSATGCRTRTIYVPDGTPVLLRETVKNAKVFVPDESGSWTPGVMDLREGGYYLTDPGQ